MLGTLISVGASVGMGFLSSSSQKKAAKAQYAAQKQAAETMATANRSISENERDFADEQAQMTYDVGIKSLNMETNTQLQAWELDKRALALEKGRVDSLYNQQREFKADLGMQELEFSMDQAMRRYDNAVGYIQKSMAMRRSQADRDAAEIAAQTRDQKSDAAVEADRLMATARVSAGERGAAGTNTYVRLMNEGEYFKGVSVDRIERQGDKALSDLEADLQFAAVSAEQDIKDAQLALMGQTQEASLFAKRLGMELQQLALQHSLDMETLGLEGEAMDVEYQNLKDRYDLSKSILTDQLSMSNDLSEMVFENANIQIDAQEESMIAGALATKNSQVSLANTSFLTGMISSGANIFGDYYTRSTQASAYSKQTGTPMDISRGLYGLSI